MKGFIGVLVTGLVLFVLGMSMSAQAMRSPLEPWITKIKGQVQFNAIGDSVVGTNYDTEGTLFSRVKRAVFDVAVDGGTAASIDLGIVLPAGSIIENSLIYIETAFLSDGSSSSQIYCEDLNNIMTASNIAGGDVAADGTLLAAASTGTRVVDIAAECKVYFANVGSAYNAGKLSVTINYKAGE